MMKGDYFKSFSLLFFFFQLIPSMQAAIAIDKVQVEVQQKEERQSKEVRQKKSKQFSKRFTKKNKSKKDQKKVLLGVLLFTLFGISAPLLFLIVYSLAFGFSWQVVILLVIGLALTITGIIKILKYFNAEKRKKKGL